MPQLKEIFVVDGNLVITPVKIPESAWEHKSGIFTAKIGSQPIIGLCDGWNKFTTYAGFETMKQAKSFKADIQEYERQRRLMEKKRKARLSSSLHLHRWRD